MAANDAGQRERPAFDTPEHRALHPQFYADYAALNENRLAQSELFWRDHCNWLKDRGYVLRPRYQPEWVASWAGKDVNTWLRAEDGIVGPGGVLDAVRASDDLPVMIKRKMRIRSTDNPDIQVFDDHELRIIQKFSSEPLASDPRNHCVPLLDILEVPFSGVPGTDDMDLMVIPLLFEWTYPPFTTIGEAVGFLSQIFEGLHFMHSHNVWHGDCKSNNIMMDAAPIQASSVHPFQPKKTRDFTAPSRWLTRTEKPVKYYWIDFDLSGVHDPAKGPPLTDPGYGGMAREVPEFAFEDRMCDPFAVDVWCLANMVRQRLTEAHRDSRKVVGLQFMDELLADMAHEEPAMRPRMDEVVDQFSKLTATLSQWQLRSRFAREGEFPLFVIFRSAFHWARQARLVWQGIPAIPSP